MLFKWHRTWCWLPCAVRNGLFCPAWQQGGAAGSWLIPVQLKCWACVSCKEGSAGRMEGGRPVPSQKTCCRPSVGISFYLLLSPLAGTHILLFFGWGTLLISGKSSRGAGQALCMVRLSYFLSFSICKRAGLKKSKLFLTACVCITSFIFIPS